MDRERRLDRIREHADKLERLSKAYNRLVHMAEKEEEPREEFLNIVEAAGEMTMASLQQLHNIVSIIWQVKELDE